MLILGHRGASADAPENTLPAFQAAVAQGADGVELDAMVCGSGEVVVCHDPQLSRLAKVPWEVAKTPLSKLRALDVGSILGFAPAGIPLLEEVLDFLPSPLVINIELKCEAFDDLGLARKVGALVVERQLSERVVISSFNPVCLARMALAYPKLRRGYLIDPEKPYWIHGGLLAPALSNYSVHPFEQACTSSRIAAWKARGLKVATWTVDSPERANELSALGVDLLITNRPGQIRVARG
jgi:glycerophosphoryl diester phosphodiesterase